MGSPVTEIEASSSILMAVLIVHCAGNSRLVVFAFIWNNSSNNSDRVLDYNREGRNYSTELNTSVPQIFQDWAGEHALRLTLAILDRCRRLLPSTRVQRLDLWYPSRERTWCKVGAAQCMYNMHRSYDILSPKAPALVRKITIGSPKHTACSQVIPMCSCQHIFSQCGYG